MPSRPDILQIILPRNAVAAAHLSSTSDDAPIAHLQPKIGPSQAHEHFTNTFRNWIQKLEMDKVPREARQMDYLVLSFDPPISAALHDDDTLHKGDKLRLEGEQSVAWTPFRRALDALRTGTYWRRVTAAYEQRAVDEGRCELGWDEAADVDVCFVFSATLNEDQWGKFLGLFPEGSDEEIEREMRGEFPECPEGTDREVLRIIDKLQRTPTVLCKPKLKRSASKRSSLGVDGVNALLAERSAKKNRQASIPRSVTQDDLIDVWKSATGPASLAKIDLRPGSPDAIYVPVKVSPMKDFI